MAYNIHKADGSPLTIPDNVIDEEFYDPTANGPGAGIGTMLVGRNSINAGGPIAQNFLQLTENFCGDVMPSDTTAMQGQLWFNKTSSTTGTLYVRVSSADTGGLINWQPIGGSGGPGSVTSIDVTGGVTGLTTTGGPVTTSGTIVIDGVLAIAHGGTGATTAEAASNAILPVQSGNAGKYLYTDGSRITWETGGGGGGGGSGYSGVSGYSGISGTSGYSGSSGAAGAPGGTSGYSGFSGVGYSGTNGASGYSGYSGVVGASGYSGTNGSAFPTGTLPMNNNSITGIKTATFSTPPATGGTSGNQTINWANGQNWTQASPNGTLTYTFSPPPGACHLQLVISAAIATHSVNWPASVVWINAVYASVANKAAIVNFWYDGVSTYYGAYGTQV